MAFVMHAPSDTHGPSGTQQAQLAREVEPFLASMPHLRVEICEPGELPLRRQAQMQRLLYRRYVREQQWKFGDDNPVGLRILHGDTPEPELTDDFVPRSVYVLVTARSGQELVGSMRLVPQAAELRCYEHRLTAPIRRSLAESPDIWEINRTVVDDTFRGHKGAFWLLLVVAGVRCADTGAICTSPYGFLQKIYCAAGGMPLGEFSYEAHDPCPALAMLFSSQKTPASVHALMRRAAKPKGGVQEQLAKESWGSAGMMLMSRL